MRWHCHPDTGFEIRALAVWGRARYLSVTEAPHNTEWGRIFFVSFKLPRPGTEPRILAWKAAVLTTITLGPPQQPPCPKYIIKIAMAPEWIPALLHEKTLWGQKKVPLISVFLFLPFKYDSNQEPSIFKARYHDRLYQMFFAGQSWSCQSRNLCSFESESDLSGICQKTVK